MAFEVFGAEAFSLPSRSFSDVVMLIGKADDRLVVKIQESHGETVAVSYHTFPYPPHLNVINGMRFSAVLASVAGRSQELDVVRLCAHPPGNWTSCTILVYKDVSHDPLSIIETRESHGLTSSDVKTASGFLFSRGLVQAPLDRVRSVFDLDSRFVMARDLPDSYDHPLSFARQKTSTKELQVLFPHTRPAIYHESVVLGSFTMTRHLFGGRTSKALQSRASYTHPAWLTLPEIEDETTHNFNDGDLHYAPRGVSGVQCHRDVVVAWYVMSAGDVHFICALGNGCIKHTTIGGDEIGYFRIGTRFVFVVDAGAVYIVHRQQQTRDKILSSSVLFDLAVACPVDQVAVLDGTNFVVAAPRVRLLNRLVGELDSHTDKGPFNKTYRNFARALRVAWGMVDSVQVDPFRSWIDPTLSLLTGKLRQRVTEQQVCAALIAGMGPSHGFDPPIYLFAHGYGGKTVRFLVGGLSSGLVGDSTRVFEPLLAAFGLQHLDVFAARGVDAWVESTLYEKTRRITDANTPTITDFVVVESFEILQSDVAEMKRFVHHIPGVGKTIRRDFRLVEWSMQLDAVVSPITEVFRMQYILSAEDAGAEFDPRLCRNVIQKAQQLATPSTTMNAVRELRGRAVSIYYTDTHPGQCIVPRHMIVIDASQLPAQVFLAISSISLDTFKLLIAAVVSVTKSLVFQTRFVDGAFERDASVVAPTVEIARAVFYTSMMDSTLPFLLIPEVDSAAAVIDGAMNNPAHCVHLVTKIDRGDGIPDYEVMFRVEGCQRPVVVPSTVVKEEPAPVAVVAPVDDNRPLVVGDTPHWDGRSIIVSSDADRLVRDDSVLEVAAHLDESTDQVRDLHIAKDVVRDLIGHSGLLHSYVYDMIVESLALVCVPVRAKPVSRGVDMPVFSGKSQLIAPIRQLYDALVAAKHPYYVYNTAAEVEQVRGRIVVHNVVLPDQFYLITADKAKYLYRAWTLAATFLTNGLGSDVRARTFAFMFVDLYIYRTMNAVMHPDFNARVIGNLLIRWHGAIADPFSSDKITPRESFDFLNRAVVDLTGDTTLPKVSIWLKRIGKVALYTVYIYNLHHLKSGKGDIEAVLQPVGSDDYGGCAHSFGVTEYRDGYPRATSDPISSGLSLDVDAFIASAPTLDYLRNAYFLYARQLGIPMIMHDHLGLAVMASPGGRSLILTDLLAVMRLCLTFEPRETDMDLSAFEVDEFRGLVVPAGIVTFVGLAPLCLFAHGVGKSLLGDHDMREALITHVPVVELSNEYLDLVDDDFDVGKLVDILAIGNRLLFDEENRPYLNESLSGAFGELGNNDSIEDNMAFAYTVQLMIATIASMSQVSVEVIPSMDDVYETVRDMKHGYAIAYVRGVVDEADTLFETDGAFDAFVSSFDEAPALIERLGDMGHLTGPREEEILMRADEMVHRRWSGDERITTLEFRNNTHVAGNLLGRLRHYQPLPRVHSSVCVRRCDVGARLMIRHDGTPLRHRLVDITYQLLTFAGVVMRCTAVIDAHDPELFNREMDVLRKEFYNV